nr:hypothetical protein [Tanacetum cinerariifolium]
MLTIFTDFDRNAKVGRFAANRGGKCNHSLGNDMVRKHDERGNKPNDYHLFTPQSHYETKEVSSDEDVDEWLNKELSKRMIREYKEEEEDALIDILKTMIEECKSVNKKARTPSSKIQGVSFVAEEEDGDRAGTNMMPKLLFKHLKLANLKKTSMAIEMGNMKNKAPLGIVENIPEMKKVTFDMNGKICHSRVPLEKIYMVSSIQEKEYINPHEIKNNNSPTLGQRTFHYNKKSVDTIDSGIDSQENEVGSHLYEIISRWHVCKPVHITSKVCEEYYGIWPTCNPDLSFCSGYEAIYEKEENGMLKQWICFRDHERQNVGGKGMKLISSLK